MDEHVGEVGCKCNVFFFRLPQTKENYWVKEPNVSDLEIKTFW